MRLPVLRSRSATTIAGAIVTLALVTTTAACGSSETPDASATTPASTAAPTTAPATTAAPTSPSTAAPTSAAPAATNGSTSAPKASTQPKPSASSGTKPSAVPKPTATARPKPRITVSKTTGLDPDGQTLVVKGSGFNVNKGVYIALCVKPAAGQLPSPCGGGIDTTGTSGASAWISSNPPRYAVNLVKPYGPNGTFTVSIKVSSEISKTIDCRTTSCVIATRNDHTRTSDRSQDVLVPVTFAKN